MNRNGWCAASAGDPGYARGRDSSEQAGVGDVYPLKLDDFEFAHERRGVIDLCARLREGGSLACEGIAEPASRETALPRPHR